MYLSLNQISNYYLRKVIIHLFIVMLILELLISRNMKWHLFFTLLTIGIIGCRESPISIDETARKNVIIILVDDLGWKDLGCYGSSFYESPHIDKLAAQSHVFTNAYASNPVCSPTRAAILTGRHPSRIGITDWIPGSDPSDRQLKGPEDFNQLPLSEITIAERLKEEGYATFFAGKWHLGSTGYFPEDQGFDINMGGHHMGQPPGGYYAPYKNPKLTDRPEGEYLTDRLTDESIKFMEGHKEDPFLLYLSYYTVHTPIQASKRHIGKFQEKKKLMTDSLPRVKDEGSGRTVQNQYNDAYASMVYALDENVGRLLDKVAALGLNENTMIIFTSDNGGLSTLQNYNYTAPTSVTPLRAGKGWAYEGGIRVPLIIKRPLENIQEQAYHHTPVVSTDLYPTIIEELGLSLTNKKDLDGRSLSMVLDDDSKELHEILFWDYPHYHGSGWTPGSAIRKGAYKLIHFYESDYYELYNVEEDISESHDLAKEQPELLKSLIEDLSAERKRLNVKAPTPNKSL